MSRKTIHDIQAKTGKAKITCLTAYTAPLARLLDQHVDILLVGDSLGMVLYEYENTLPVTLDQMIEHTKSVIKATSDSCVIMDLPFGTYQADSKVALKSAIRIMKESGAHAVKLEGGHLAKESIERIIKAGIPVMGHLGLTPQSIYKFGTYTVRAKDEDEAKILIDDSKMLENIGCFSIVLEKIPNALAKKVASNLKLPIIGIGAGSNVDGQVLVSHDMLGMNKNFSPRFLRRYLDLDSIVSDAVKKYSSDIKSGNFPNKEEQY